MTGGVPRPTLDHIIRDGVRQRSRPPRCGPRNRPLPRPCRVLRPDCSANANSEPAFRAKRIPSTSCQAGRPPVETARFDRLTDGVQGPLAPGRVGRRGSAPPELAEASGFAFAAGPVAVLCSFCDPGWGRRGRAGPTGSASEGRWTRRPRWAIVPVAATTAAAPARRRETRVSHKQRGRWGRSCLGRSMRDNRRSSTATS